MKINIEKTILSSVKRSKINTHVSISQYFLDNNFT